MADRRKLWGAETDKAIANFPISGETVPLAVVRWPRPPQSSVMVSPRAWRGTKAT